MPPTTPSPDPATSPVAMGLTPADQATDGVTPANIQWAAELAHVREVTLRGSADLAYWREQLRGEGLSPANTGGRAELMIVAAEGKFMGLRFRELSFSVVVGLADAGCSNQGSTEAYLVQAFNARWLFAFCERTLFSTPYDYGDVRLTASIPAAVELIDERRVAFRVAMEKSGPASLREPTRRGDDGWSGTVYLPTRRGKARRYFVARIQGETGVYPFLSDQDAFVVRPGRRSSMLRALLDSDFQPREWVVREDAQHAKSKTYSRDRC